MKKIYKKNWLFTPKTVATAFALLFASGMAMAQLSGTYTVNSASASSLTTKNFQSFSDLADSLESFGVNGAVTVNVVASSGPYSENAKFGTVFGASSTNTITINGNGETISATGSVIELNGIDYLTIDNLDILATGTASGTRGVWIHNASDENTVSNCDIEFSGYTGSSNSTAFVSFSGDATSHSSTGSHGKNNTITDNTMHGTSNTYGPYYGVDMYGSSSYTSGNIGNSVHNNDIRDVRYMYIYAYYMDDFQGNGNELHHQRSGSSSNYAIYNYYCDAVNRDVTFNDNVIHHFTGSYFYGTLFYYSNGNSTNHIQVSGNSITDNTVSSYHYGIRTSYCDYPEVSDNEIIGNRSGGYFYYSLGNRYNDYATFDNNTVEDNVSGTYFYYTIYNYRSNNSTITNNVINNNQAGTYFFYPSYHYYSNSTVFKGNQFTNNSAGSYWYYTWYSYQSNNLTIEDNVVDNNSAQYYFYASYIYRGSNINLISNKMTNNTAGYYMYYGFHSYYVSTGSMINNLYAKNSGTYGTLYGIYEGYCSDFTIAHNTIDIRGNMDYYYYGMYVYHYQTPVNVVVKNNILRIAANPGYGYGYPIYCYYNTDQIDWGYNVVDVTGTTGTKNFYANSSAYGSFTAWAAAADDETSIVANPMYDWAGNDFVPSNPLIANMAEVGLATDDITGATRTACGPDVGAYEFFLDHSVSNLVFTGTNECGGYMEDVTVDITNGAAVDLAGLELFFDINGSGTVTEEVSVDSLDTYTHTFTTQAEFHEPGLNVLSVGLGCDDNAANNVLTHNINITAGPSGGDMTMGTTFEGYFNDGTIANPDVAVPNTTSVYDIVPPTKYTAASYGSDWDVSYNSMTSGGMSTSGLGVVVDGSAGTVTVDPDASLTDSMLYVSFTINDLNTGCDSVVGRWMYVPFTPSVDFDVVNICLGEVAKFKNQSTMGGSDFMIYKWNYNDPNASDDTSEIKDGFWEYSTYGTFSVDLEVRNQTYPKFAYSLTKSITVTPTPVTDFDVVNACEGVDIQFNDQTTSPLTDPIAYVWNFGDGNTSTMQNPTHQYAMAVAAGYNVTLTSTQNGCSSSKTKKAYQFATPVADFSTTGACNLEEIAFTNNTSLAIGKAGYTWDFGDNGVSTLSDPTHTYSTPGTHSVTMTAYSEFGCQDDVTIDVTLLESPEADFSYDATCNLTPVNFSMTGTYPGTEAQNDFAWDFNGEATGSGVNASFLFPEVGTKTVTLTVSSLNGCSSTTSQELDVVLQAVADFEAADICEGDEAVFTNKSSVAAGDLTYTWYFGEADGNGVSTSDYVSPRHRYTVQNTTRLVNVRLVAEVDGGCDAEITKAITINAAPDASWTADVQGRTVVFNANDDGNTIYAWRFGNGSSDNANDPVYTYDNVDQGEFEVCLSTKNDLCWAEECNTVTVDLIGIDELTQDDAMINVYPNPSTGIFNLDVENASDDVAIVVSDILGNQLDVTVTDNLNGNFIVDLSTIADGVYFVQVRNGDYFATKRITVSK